MANDECPYRSEFARHHYFRGFAEGFAKGKAKGRARAIRKLLHLRGFTVPEAAATRVDTCTDLSQLDIWLDRAVTAETIDEVFAD